MGGEKKYGELTKLPAGAYALALSGGADSTALLFLLRQQRPDINLHIVHLNHQTRGLESDAEEAFVRRLAERLGLPHTIASRAEIEAQLPNRPRNKSALFRALRRHLFAETILQHGLAGVLLAHHADDQAETILHRLLRGSGARGLRGMATQSVQRINGKLLTFYRPLLNIPRHDLRTYLREHDENWCEDSSNQSDRYLRNRLRRMLSQTPELSAAVAELGAASAKLNAWVLDHAPELKDPFEVREIWDLPGLLAEESARRYLRRCGCPPDELSPAVVRRVIDMANDAAAPPRRMFPGNMMIWRSGGMIRSQR